MSEVSKSWDLPSDLEAIALAQFDRLNAAGELLYTAPEHKVVEDKGFLFDFVISAGLTKKPIVDKGTQASAKVGGPFANPEPEFVVAPQVGPDHYLILNKFCVSRPMCILPTIKYRPQTEGLDEGDITAAWTMLQLFKSEHMIIYNCGSVAGSSQGHKHLQLLPIFRPEGFKFFTDGITIGTDTPTTLPGAPHKHFIIGLSRQANPAEIATKLRTLMELTLDSLGHSEETPAYNLILVKDWLMVIPRTHRDRDGLATNAAGMIGVVWVKSMDEMNGWLRLGPSDHLRYLGIAA